ncbi:MAG: hypothetical protein HY370_10180 [Proteobacteria bacterium]|nr:hypothetical protein [Pseudomonadota bacterium]
MKNGIRSGLFIAAFCLIAGAGCVAASPTFAQDKPALFNKKGNDGREYIGKRKELTGGKSSMPARLGNSSGGQKKSGGFEKNMAASKASLVSKHASYKAGYTKKYEDYASKRAAYYASLYKQASAGTAGAGAVKKQYVYEGKNAASASPGADSSVPAEKTKTSKSPFKFFKSDSKD